MRSEGQGHRTLVLLLLALRSMLHRVQQQISSLRFPAHCRQNQRLGQAKRGRAKHASVSASDISSSMASEAARRAEELGVTTAKFEASDLESVSGEYDTVTCIDVMIHYPTEKMSDMVKHVASLSTDRVLVSFAPKTPQYVLLKKVGELFPGPSKTTRAYLHPEQSVRAALEEAGFKVKRSKLTKTNFYFSTLLEAQKV